MEGFAPGAPILCIITSLLSNAFHGIVGRPCYERVIDILRTRTEGDC